MRGALLFAALMVAGAAHAQEDDRGYIVAFLEDSLSDAGRQITITGFTGALSSRATMETLTIADDAGVWLTVSGVTLDWSRSSLLSGALEVSELSADSIELLRVPDTSDDSLPSPEASGFSLPTLPVTIDIQQLAIDRIVLGPDVLGQSVEGSLAAKLGLADGAGQAELDLIRSGDGPAGEIVLDASYDNTTRQLGIALTAAEDARGIVAELLGIPGAPATSFRLEGQGPLEAFEADIALATDGEDRLAGTVGLSGAVDGDYQLLADLRGNLAPLLVPDMIDFFGTDVGLTLDAVRSASGRMTLNRFAVTARALQAEGSGIIAADGLPETISLTGRLASPDGEPVLLPFGDVPTRLDEAEFSFASKLSDGEDWSSDFTLRGLHRPDFVAETLTVKGSGRLGRTSAGNSVDGTVLFNALGLRPTDPGLATALGQTVAGGLSFNFMGGSGAVSLSDIRLEGADYDARGALQIEGLETGLRTSGTLEVTATDLSRFGLLAGRPIAGSGTVNVTGTVGGLSGLLDGVLQISANDLGIGVEQIDRFLLGTSKATLSVLRDETGTTIRSLDVTAGTLVAAASGRISSTGSDLAASLDLSDLSAFGPGFGGLASLDARFSGTPELGSLSFSGLTEGLRTGNASADLLLAGQSRVSGDLALLDGTVQVNAANLTNPQFSIAATGELAAAARRVMIDARLNNLGLLVPDVQGPLTISGQATDDGAGYLLDLSGRGPGQVDGKVSGRLSPDLSSADLSISGSGQAALANLILSPRAVEGSVRYDLRLLGPLRTTSLAGRVTLASGRLTDPGLGFALEGIEALAVLGSGQAQVSATSRLSSGGLLRIDGPIGLAPPFQSDLRVALDRVRLTDPELYEAQINGSIAAVGPLAGGASVSGALTLSEAEIRVPESGFDSAGSLLDIRHLNEPPDVRQTRDRAGLLDGPGGSGGRGSDSRAPFRLDLTISAPSRIFLRGRGIDAELGGQIRLLGTSDAIIPSGAFSLIRGRLDILGKRLVLSEADLQLEGSFVPVVRIAASTESDDIVSFIRIEGRADDPEVSFTSVPDLPQEEVLARLLFGHGLANLSAIQAAKLANAVAVLAGRGGEGVISRLRQGFGLDDLDVATAADGTTALTAGKYITENLYTEIEIEQGGKSRINLNLDLRKGVTVKGRVGDDGETGIGIYFERDY